MNNTEKEKPLVTDDFSYGIIPVRKHSSDGIEKVEFLLVLHNAGHWSFPKGHREGDETPIETAQRELKEETGLACGIICTHRTLKTEYVFSKNQQKVHKQVTYFIGFVESNANVCISSNEISDYAWLPYHKAKEHITFKTDKVTLSEAYAHITKEQCLL